MVRSQSLHQRIELLTGGTTLTKIRDKGIRGINLYKRTFTLDLENQRILFSPHNDNKFVCGLKGKNLIAVTFCLTKLINILNRNS